MTRSRWWPPAPRHAAAALLWSGALIAVLAAKPSSTQEPGWPSLLAPLLAILLAVLTRQLFLSLFGALLLAAVARFGPVGALPGGLRSYFLETVRDASHLYIIGFTLTLLGMVQVIARAGGAAGVVSAFSRKLDGVRSAQLGTVGLGLLIFFDDYANAMLVGPTMRPVCDRLRISREKLAYLVDSTAAPVAGLTLLSTWVGYEAGVLGEVAQGLGLPDSGYALLVQALPLRFYCVYALLFTATIAVLDRDFGPMLRAERRARRSGKLLRDGAAPLGGAKAQPAEPSAGTPARWVNAALPIGAVVVAMLIGLLLDGGGLAVIAKDPLAAFDFGFWQAVLRRSENNVQVLFWSVVLGAALAVALPLGHRGLRPSQALSAFRSGVSTGFFAVGVLLLAWGLAAACKDLGTGTYLVGLLGPALPAESVPLLTFLLASAVSFAIGSSWGTMALLLPTAVPLAFALGGAPVMLLTMASVLDGSIFGDHCSPISDTTVMSSIGASCDHLDHVATQLPYAVAAMVIALLFGYFPVVLGVPLPFAYALGATATVLLITLIGRPSSAPVAT